MDFVAWDSATAFFRMGGYAAFVWPAFGITAALMAAEIVLLTRRHRSLLRERTRRVTEVGFEKMS